MKKDLTLATWNGRTVLIDDDVPFDSSSGAYTSYILGRGAFDYCDIGAKVPNETTRDPLKAGGKDLLISRQRKLLAPRGISYKTPTTTTSPMPTDFKTAANWSLVKNEDGARLNHKAIPIARIKSLG